MPEFSFPPDWQIDNSKFGDDLTEHITITHGNENNQYTLSTKALGRNGPITDEITNEEIIIDNIKFTKRTWKNNNSPFLISIMSAIPYFNHIEISLPTTSSDQMLTTIDQIIESFRFTDN